MFSLSVLFITLVFSVSEIRTSDILSGGANRICAEAFNPLRKNHRVGELTPNPELEKQAIKRAEELAKNGALDSIPGEIIFEEDVGQGYGSAGVWLEICGDAVEEWKKGQKYYDFFNPGPAEGAKEFTQVVWKESKEFGCGDALSFKTNKMYLVCNFTPAGNVEGQFQKNVFSKME